MNYLTYDAREHMLLQDRIYVVLATLNKPNLSKWAVNHWNLVLKQLYRKNDNMMYLKRANC